MQQKTEEEYKRDLTPEQYKVLREKATEAPFSGKYNLHNKEGVYTCGACGTELFTSNGKYDSGCGWPSFYEAKDNDVIRTEIDLSYGRERTEILCRNCDSHLGHVFNDGPHPTGVRFCVNSLSLDFKENSES